MVYRGPQRYDFKVRIQPRNKPVITIGFFAQQLSKTEVLFAIACDPFMGEESDYYLIVNRIWIEEHTNGYSFKGSSLGTLRIERTPIDARRSL
jgi:hypothetical protein